MAIRIPISPVAGQATLVALGSGLITAAAYLPEPWGLIAAALGGLLGGKALLRRPGDVRAK